MTQPEANDETKAREFDRRLFQISTLTDALRDSAKDLLAVSSRGAVIDAKVVAGMGERFNTLRAASSDLLAAGPGNTVVTEWTSPLEPDTTVDAVFDAAATLARVLDTVIGEEAYLANRSNQRWEISQLMEKIGVATSEPPTRPGQYI